MSNLKSELQSLVEEFELQSGIINRLATTAFEDIANNCRATAKKGERNVTVPISFTGCCGGYSKHVPRVLEILKLRLNMENLTYAINHTPDSNAGCGYTVYISW